MMAKVPKKKTVSVNFSHAVIFLLDFLSFEYGTDRLPRNVGKELPLYAVQYVSRARISHDNLALQTLVWLRMVWFTVIQFGAVWLVLHMQI
jgi:hypothetical protein